MFNSKYSSLFIGLGLVLIKIFLIEIDPPKLHIAYYQPIDEAYYVFPAYNYYETGIIWGADKATVFGNPWLSNFITYITLNLFGDNFYGLRLSSIFFGLVSIFFFWKLINTITKNRWTTIFTISFLCLSYPFTLSNLIVEPTIARIAVMLFAMFITQKIWLDKNISSLKTFLVSLLIITLWLFTYPTNAFTVLAFVIVIFYKSAMINGFSLKKSIPHFIRISLILIISLSISLLVWYLFSTSLGDNPLDFYKRAGDYSNRVNLNLKGLIFNIMKIGSANIFLFNATVLFAFIFGVLLSFFLFLKKKLNRNIIPVLIFFSAFLSQTLFINDFPQRKLLILLPIILLIIVNIFDNEIIYIKKQRIKSLRLAVFSIFATLILLVLNIFLLNSYVNFYSITLSIIILSIITYNIYKAKFSMISWVPIISLIFILEIINTFNYSILNSSKNYLEVTNDLKKYDKKSLIGGWSMGFRSNNNAEVFLNKYLYYGEIDKFWQKTDSIAKSNYKIDYSISYAKDSTYYKKINFEPLKTIMDADESIYTEDIILYREIE